MIFAFSRANPLNYFNGPSKSNANVGRSPLSDVPRASFPGVAQTESIFRRPNILLLFRLYLLDPFSNPARLCKPLAPNDRTPSFMPRDRASSSLSRITAWTTRRNRDGCSRVGSSWNSLHARKLSDVEGGSRAADFVIGRVDRAKLRAWRTEGGRREEDRASNTRSKL